MAADTLHTLMTSEVEKGPVHPGVTKTGVSEVLPKTPQALHNSLAVPCHLLSLKSTDNQGSKPFMTTDQKVEGRQLTSSEKIPEEGTKI